MFLLYDNYGESDIQLLNNKNKEVNVMKVPFCTCVDHECRCNPVNHPHGCTPCIAKCLAENEIPVCFYRKIEPNMDRKQDYTFTAFANFVIDHEKGKLD